MNIDKIAKAIEEDAGEAIPGLKEGLQEMKEGKAARTYTPEQLLVISARKTTELSQLEFAEFIKTPVATLRGWEQGRFKPAGGILRLMEIIKSRPDIIKEFAA